MNSEINRDVEHEVGSTGTYDHAISSLALCELYGMNPTRNAARMKTAIEKALRVTLEMQHWPKDIPDDEGGWRYINDYDQTDSDLSVTGWHLMFLRSGATPDSTCPIRPLPTRSPTFAAHSADTMARLPTRSSAATPAAAA